MDILNLFYLYFSHCIKALKITKTLPVKGYFINFLATLYYDEQQQKGSQITGFNLYLHDFHYLIN